MGPKHERTLKAIFEDPVRSNIAWRDIEAMLESAGAEITEGAGSRMRIALNGVRAVFHRPHPQQEGSRKEARNQDLETEVEGCCEKVFEAKDKEGRPTRLKSSERCGLVQLFARRLA